MINPTSRVSVEEHVRVVVRSIHLDATCTAIELNVWSSVVVLCLDWQMVHGFFYGSWFQRALGVAVKRMDRQQRQSATISLFVPFKCIQTNNAAMQ